MSFFLEREKVRHFFCLSETYELFYETVDLYQICLA